LREEELQTLVELGLTDLEAKVYLSLVQLGNSKATEICKLSKVTRPDIYRVLNELVELGMVEKILTKPLMFRASPLRSATAYLLEKRNKKTHNLKTKIAKMVKSAEKQKEVYNSKNMGDFNFIEIPYRGSILKEDIELQRIDWNTINIVTLWSRFTRWICANNKCIKDVLAKGVKFRIIVSCPKNSQASITDQCLTYSKDLFKNPLFEIRYLFTSVPALISIYDDKAVRLVLKPAPFDCGGVGPDMYSNHPGLVGMARTYFESLWITAEKCEQQKEITDLH
jgi:predicted transcriptional regulator